MVEGSVVDPVKLIGDLSGYVSVNLVLQVLRDIEHDVDVVVERLARIIGNVARHGRIYLVLRGGDPAEDLFDLLLLPRMIDQGLLVGGDGGIVPIQESVAVGVERLYVAEQRGAEVGLEIL